MGNTIYNQWETKKIVAGFTTDFNGRFKYNNQDDYEHFNALGMQFGIGAERMLRLHQAHTKDVLVVKEEHAGEGIKKVTLDKDFDGMVTNCKRMMLCVAHADCTPVFFYDEENEAIGIAHSGRKGTILEISVEIINAMKKEYGTNPQKLECIIGPFISKNHHEVESFIADEFNDKFTPDEMEQFLEYKGEKAYIDMGMAIKISLMRCGVPENNIIFDTRCTYETTGIYSWRRDHDPDARNISFIMLT